MPHLPAKLGLLGGVLAAALIVGPALAQSQEIAAAGDGQHLWLVQPAAEGPAFGVFLSDPADAQGRLVRVKDRTGRLVAHGQAAAGGQLWLVYDNLSIQSLSAVVQTGVPPRATDPVNQSPLPQGVAVRALAAQGSGGTGGSGGSGGSGGAGLWVLVQVESAAALATIDALPTANTTTAPSAAATAAPPRTPTAPPATPAAPPPATQRIEPVDRLLHLERDQWMRVDLPDRWVAGSAAWLGLRPGGGGPILATLFRPWHLNGSPQFLHVYEYGPTPGGAASSPAAPPAAVPPAAATSAPAQPSAAAAGAASAPTPAPAPAPGYVWTQRYSLLAEWMPQLAVVADQVVVAQVVPAAATPTGPTTVPASGGVAGGPSAGGLSIRLGVLRPESPAEPIPLGTLQLPDAAAGSPWAVINYHDTVAVIARDTRGKTIWARMDIYGRVVAPSAELAEEPTSLWSLAWGYLFLALVVAAATLVLFLFWRRDGARSQVRLPRNLVLADPWRRVLAGLIDLAPCLGLTMVLFKLESLDWLAMSPDQFGSWRALLPRLAAIGLCVAHTTIAEIFTARSLGKSVLGLRVTGLSGGQPNLWQCLGRGLLRFVELMVPPLLVLPLFTTSRQRLGDLVARTVVAAPAPEPEDEGPGEE